MIKSEKMFINEFWRLVVVFSQPVTSLCHDSVFISDGYLAPKGEWGHTEEHRLRILHNKYLKLLLIVTTGVLRYLNKLDTLYYIHI